MSRALHLSVPHYMGGYQRVLCGKLGGYSQICHMDMAYLVDDEKGGRTEERKMEDCPHRAYLAAYIVVESAQLA